MLEKLDDYEIIIIARGGGSLDDLIGYNNEKLANEIFNSKKPVVTAIGHETDTTICDLVSDFRAATPSEAAEFITPNIIDVKEEIENTKVYLIAKKIHGLIKNSGVHPSGIAISHQKIPFRYAMYFEIL